MAAKYGDAFYPVASYFAEPIDGGNIGVELRWAENEADLKKELNSMRRCALDAGFSEYEISTVYDKRMLTVLRKASKYDRIMAAKPVPVQPDRGRALEPGAASSVGSVSRRRNIDDVMRRQAASGSLDDTALVMERLLR